MFWFGGMVGMAIESSRFKRWLGASVYESHPAGTQIPEPPSYKASFNPLPAIIIGVTGAAMSAHHQTYLFQVGISVFPNRPVGSPELFAGQNTRVVGLFPRGFCRASVLYLLLPLASTAQIAFAFTTPH
jgi:hypothetical protein